MVGSFSLHSFESSVFADFMKMASFVSVIVGLIIMACAFAGLIVAADECTRYPSAR